MGGVIYWQDTEGLGSLVSWSEAAFNFAAVVAHSLISTAIPRST